MAGTYPANKMEVEKFAIGVINALHEPSMRDKIMKQLTAKQGPIEVKIGVIATQFVMAMLQKVKEQSGRPPHLKLIINAIRLTVQELAAMCKAAGIKVSIKQQKTAAKLAGDSIQAAMQQGMQQQQAAQQGMQQPGPPQQGAPQPGILQRPQGGGY